MTNASTETKPKAAHTPGPWRVEENTTLIWGNCDPDDPGTNGMGYPVAEARVMLGHGSSFCRTERYEEAQANARLIAAAPALLEALKGLLADIESLMGESDGVAGLHLNGDVAPWSELDEGGRFERLSSLSAARAALAKAEGQP